MDGPVTPPSNRPPVLRTYGKTKREPLLFPILSPPPALTHSSSFRSTDGSSCLPSSETGLSEGWVDEVRIRSSSPVEETVADVQSSINGLRWVKKETKGTNISKTTTIEPARTKKVMPLPRGRTSSSKPIPGPSSGQSTLRAFFAPRPMTLGSPSTGSRLRTENLPASSTTSSSTSNHPTSSSSSLFTLSSSSNPTPTQPKKLVQMHFKRSYLSTSSPSGSSSSSTFTTCKKCNLSYIRAEEEEERGGEGSTVENLHRANCERVTRGMVWHDQRGGASGKGKVGGLGKEVRGEVGFERRGEGGVGAKGKGRGIGRIIQVDGSDGLINAKIASILSSIDTVLSAPPLPASTMKQCQIFLFLTSSPPPPPLTTPGKRLAPSAIGNQHRRGKDQERVVGCVVTQGIRWGMKIVGQEGKEGDEEEGAQEEEGEVGGKRKRLEGLVVVEPSAGSEADDDGGILCYPERIPVKMGVHRIFTVPGYRGCGIVRSLLDEACRHTIYGYKCDPLKGDVAFSQPTQSGRRVMNTWGEGRVLVFNEDEQDDDTSDQD